MGTIVWEAHYIPFYETLSVEVGDHEPLCRYGVAIW